MTVLETNVAVIPQVTCPAQEGVMPRGTAQGYSNVMCAALLVQVLDWLWGSWAADPAVTTPGWDPAASESVASQGQRKAPSWSIDSQV